MATLTILEANDSSVWNRKDALYNSHDKSNMIETQLDLAKSSTNEQKAEKRDSFTRWRPSYHLISSKGWMNDPCGMGYDPNTQLYHIAFQWNPEGNDWGNASWCRATSKDLVSWDIDQTASLVPTAAYDNRGIFTGCLQLTGIVGKQEGMITAIYTSVNRLPIHYTLPYHRGSESLSLATSIDGGKTWERAACNPILPGAPEDVEVVGWRDPFLTSWKSVDELLERTTGNSGYLYGIISGGIKNKTPTTFLYSVDENDLRKWEYLGPLVDIGLNYRLSRWSGDMGINWEVTNFVSLLDDDGFSKDFLIMGCEGCLQDEKFGVFKTKPTDNEKITRSQQWMSGPLVKREDGSIEMKYDFGGVIDHGCFYAANSFWDPLNKQQVLFGWITEVDLPDDMRHIQNWSGFLSLPRQIKLQTIYRVIHARKSKLSSITNVKSKKDDQGTFTVQTLSIRPLKSLEKLRSKASTSSLHNQHLQPLASIPSYSSCFLDYKRTSNQTLEVRNSRWEVDCEIAVGKNCEKVGISIIHSIEPLKATLLVFQPGLELFTVERAAFPTVGLNVNTATEAAPHTLFSISDPRTGRISEEPLRIRAWFDESVLEVFVNERTCISTRIYAETSRCFGITFFANEESGSIHQNTDGWSQTILTRATVWDGLEAKITFI